ncbi:MAG TPA: hypothetical protein VHQ64_13150 [Pyrinomonadaceae bacterium]|nr:hypothetical protein [Pyrinomonadaceae bacterium]
MRIVDALVTLVGHLAWPVTVLALVVVLRREIQEICKSLSRRIADPASSLIIGKGGLEIKGRVDAALGRIESLEIDQNQSKELIFGVLGKKELKAGTVPGRDETVAPELLKLADEYLKISASEWSERVRLKDECARRMSNLVLTRNVSKDLLAGQDHEGLLMALVTAIHAAPEQGDFDRISRIAQKVKRLHVKYRIAMALGRLFEQNLAGEADVARCKEILDDYNIGADPALRRRIIQTKAIINLAVGNRASSAVS